MALFVLLLAASVLPAAGQTRVLPGFAERGARGPALAKGVIVWNHGLALVAETPSGPPPYVERLQSAGWDVVRLERRWAGDTYEVSTTALIALARQLRADGYRRVVAAGQSFGAWISIAAAGREAGLFEAIVAAAPARYGAEGISATWHGNADGLYALAGALRLTRVLLFLFEGDPYDPGGRGAKLEAIFDRQHTAHAIVDRPAGFSGHDAAFGEAFAAAFGPCIAAFIDASPAQGAARCRVDSARQAVLAPR